MKKVRKSIACAAAILCALASVPASALTITADYSQLGTVYQLSNGELSNTLAAGATDVTGLFKSNVSTAINYWQNAVHLQWNTTYTFQLASLNSAVGDNAITSFDANGRPTSSVLRVDTHNAANPNDGNVVGFFLDSTPADNSEFGSIKSNVASLGGGNVNVGRIGTATSGPATGGYDMLSLLLHEIEHGLGFSSSSPRWNNVVNGAGDTLTVSSSLSGLPSSFGVPLSGSHIDGTASGGLFNDTTIALPGFVSGQRALLTAVDIYSICAVEGCAANEINTDPSASPVPEPGSVVMLVSGLALLYQRRRAKAGA